MGDRAEGSDDAFVDRNDCEPLTIAYVCAVGGQRQQPAQWRIRGPRLDGMLTRTPRRTARSVLLRPLQSATLATEERVGADDGRPK